MGDVERKFDEGTNCVSSFFPGYSTRTQVTTYVPL